MPACVEHGPRCRLRLLREDLCDNDGVSIDAIRDAPRSAFVDETQLMTTPAESRQRPGVRQTQHFATLKVTQELPGLDACTSRERRGANLTAKPHQRLAGAPPHSPQYLSDLTYASMALGARANEQREAMAGMPRA